MKRLMLIGIGTVALVAMTGCAFQRTAEFTFNPETRTHDRTTYVGISLLNKTAVSGLKVGSRTKTTSTTLSLSEGATETQAEAIKALGEALGAGIAAGARKAVTP